LEGPLNENSEYPETTYRLLWVVVRHIRVDTNLKKQKKMVRKEREYSFPFRVEIVNALFPEKACKNPMLGRVAYN